MTDLRIEQLTVMATGADEASLPAKAAKHALVLARGQSTADWLKSKDITPGVVLNLDIRTDAETLSWRDQLLNILGENKTVLYVTPVNPLKLDMLSAYMAKYSQSVAWTPGRDLLTAHLPSDTETLNGALQSEDLLGVQGAHYPNFSPAMPVMLHMAGVRLDRTWLYRLLNQVYPCDHAVYVTEELPGLEGQWRAARLEELKDDDITLSALFIPPYAFDASLESFMQVIAQLRAPDGCPWDRKQTNTSLRPYLLEETYEALEQLDNHDMEGLKEELGDLLLQIALHSQIASESNAFNITQVLQHINRKIVSRHPHVFGAVHVKDERDVVQNWEKLKEIERAGNGKEGKNGLLDGIPNILPALSQAQSIQDRAARVGFDWPEIGPVIAKVLEEMQEVSEAADEQAQAQELGDLLFAVVNLVRWYKVDAESALRQTNTKFRKRFAYIEAEAKKAERDLQHMTLEEMDLLWEASKEFDDELSPDKG